MFDAGGKGDEITQIVIGHKILWKSIAIETCLVSIQMASASTEVRKGDKASYVTSRSREKSLNTSTPKPPSPYIPLSPNL